MEEEAAWQEAVLRGAGRGCGTISPTGCRGTRSKKWERVRTSSRVLGAETGAIWERGASAILGGRRGRDGDRGAGRGRRLQVLMKSRRRKAPRDSVARSPEPLQPRQVAPSRSPGLPYLYSAAGAR